MSKVPENTPDNNRRKSDPTPHLAEANVRLEQAIAAIDRALPLIPQYSVEAVRFLRAEIVVARRRTLNVYRVLNQPGSRATR